MIRDADDYIHVYRNGSLMYTTSTPFPGPYRALGYTQHDSVWGGVFVDSLDVIWLGD